MVDTTEIKEVDEGVWADVTCSVAVVERSSDSGTGSLSILVEMRVIGDNLVEGKKDWLLVVSARLGIVPMEDGGRLLGAILILSLIELSVTRLGGKGSETTVLGIEIEGVGVGECGIGGVC